MIDSLNSDGVYINICGGLPSQQYVGVDTSRPFAGSVRYTGVQLEVFTGSNWTRFPSHDTKIELSISAIEAINWARKKMIDEAHWTQLSDQSPAVKIAFENLQKAEQQLNITIKLCQD